MDNKVFVDANFFVALYNPQDSLHSQAESLSEKLTSGDEELYLSNYVFSELTTVLSQRAGREKAVIAGEFLRKSENFTIIFVDHDLQESSWEIFCETKKKNTSFVDCSTVAIMRAEGIKKLLTFDREDFAPLLKKHHLNFFGFPLSDQELTAHKQAMGVLENMLTQPKTWLGQQKVDSEKLSEFFAGVEEKVLTKPISYTRKS
ncbi:type II toxin-antitoxin system VapC family toxin [Candidatus Gottesmanbacteria bacterium]|nr:type II toxin-antitoxin system VapC family toxin [Candidatus Gottesmanbacteria bacterium]